MRNACKHPVIVLAGIQYTHMKSLIEFIYNGEVNIDQDNLAELLRTANILKIKGLDEMASTTTTTTATPGPTIQNPAIDDTSAMANSNINTSVTMMSSDSKSMPFAADQSKTSAKKRKCVSFSDTPEIVCDQPFGGGDSMHLYGEGSGNGKRKLRSLSEIGSIIKVKQENVCDNDDDDGDDDDNNRDGNIKNEFVVTINPHSIYSSTESVNADHNSAGDDDDGGGGPATAVCTPKKQRANISRKMIRKNENFLRALEAVRDEGIGFCKAAKIHGVNNRTLWLEYQKRGYPMKNARKKSQS